MPASSPQARAPRLSCPKCGYEQDQGSQCRRCGIVFAKYKAPATTPSAARAGTQPDPSVTVPSGLFWRVFRIARWTSLCATLLVLFLILRQAPPIPIRTDPMAADLMAGKLAQVEQDTQAGMPATLRLNEAELNHWLQESLAIADAHRTAEALSDLGVEHNAELHEVQSGLKDVRINLEGNRVRAQAFFRIRGKELSLQLEGRLSALNGQLHFEPTGGKLGSLPLPKSTLDGVVTRLLDSRSHRGSLRLPPHIQDLRVQDGELTVTYR